MVLDRAIGHARGNGPGRRRGRAEGPGDDRDAVLRLLDLEGDHGDGRSTCSTSAARWRSTTGSPTTSPSTRATARARSRSATCSPTAPASPRCRKEALDLDLLADRERLVELICDAKPASAPGKLLAYHAVSGGFILGEIVQRVTGEAIREVLAEEILDPLGFRWGNYGVDAGGRRRGRAQLRHRPAAAAAGLDPRHARARRAGRRGDRRLQRPALPHRRGPGGERGHDRERALALLRDLPPRRRARRRPRDEARDDAARR